MFVKNMQVNKQISEPELLRLVANGDEQAFRQLFEQYRQRVYSFAFYLTRSEHLAEEATQEIFIKVWLNREKLAAINYFPSWLRTIIRNLAYSHMRRIAQERLFLQRMGHLPGTDIISIESQMLDKELDHFLQEAVGQLPPQQQKVYLLSRKEGWRNDAIAKEMGISINTVKNHLKAALKSIRFFLDSRTDTLLVVAMAIFFKK